MNNSGSNMLTNRIFYLLPHCFPYYLHTYVGLFNYFFISVFFTFPYKKILSLRIISYLCVITRIKS